MKKLIFCATLMAMPACNLSDEAGPTVNANNNTGNDVGVDVGEDTASADLGTPDVSMPDCSETIACPAPDDDSYTLTCVDNVCVSACTAGFQDNDMDGTCTPDCSTSDCADRGCDDSNGEALCVCPLGTFLDGDVCTLSPIVSDPEFTGTTDWTITGAEPGPTATDFLGNPGQITVRASTTCDSGTSISQSVYIPEIGQTKIVVKANSDCPSTYCDAGALPIVFLGEHRFYPNIRSSNSTAMPLTYCVPESARGQTLDFKLQTQVLGNCGFDAATLQYASADIVSDEDGSCGTPNTIENGDFQAANDGTYPGWEFKGEPETSAVVISSGGGNSLLKLKGTRCSPAKVTTKAMTTGPSAVDTGRAISVRYRTAPGSKLTMIFERRINIGYSDSLDRRAELPSSAAWSEASYCLPPDLLNTQISWTAELGGVSGGACDAATELDIDEVKLIEDPRCAFTPGEITNGDFESAAFSWVFDFNANDNAGNVDAEAETRIVNNNTVGFLQANTKCASPRVIGYVDVPRSGANAVGFDYTYRAFPDATPYGRVIVGSSTLDLTEYALLTPGSVCLPEDSQGLIQQLMVTGGHSGGCSSGTPVANPGVLQIDNLKLINDPACN